jgi:hypothetical protein
MEKSKTCEFCDRKYTTYSYNDLKYYTTDGTKDIKNVEFANDKVTVLIRKNICAICKDELILPHINDNTRKCMSCSKIFQFNPVGKSFTASDKKEN